MDVYQGIRRAAGGAMVLLLTAIFIVGCGSSTTSGSPSTTSTTATATKCPSTVKVATTTGTVQSVSNASMTVTSATGADVQVTLSSSTRVRQLMTEKASSLQEGGYVSVVTTQNADSTYSATTVLSLGTLSGSGGFGGAGGTGGGFGGSGGFGTRTASNTACRARGLVGTGGAGGFGGIGGINGTTGAGLSGKNVITGKISQVNNTVLVVNDLRSGGNFSITLTNSTQIYTFSDVTTAAIKSGQHITASGRKNGQGGIDASSVTILAGNLTV